MQRNWIGRSEGACVVDLPLVGRDQELEISQPALTLCSEPRLADFSQPPLSKELAANRPVGRLYKDPTP